jgi:hypothetical protein
VTGPSSFALVDYSARKQDATAKGTPSAEFTAISDAVTRSTAVIWIFLEQLWQREVSEVILTDNAAALATLRSGNSKALSHLRRTMRVSIGLVADYANGANTVAEKVATGDNCADLFTKALEADVFWRHVLALGIV